MFNVTCEINEAKKNSTNKIQILSVSDKYSHGYIEIKLGKESIIIDGSELRTAIENCTSNEGHCRRRYLPARKYVTIDTDEDEE